jgi:hypothetical protein
MGYVVTCLEKVEDATMRRFKVRCEPLEVVVEDVTIYGLYVDPGEKPFG